MVEMKPGKDSRPWWLCVACWVDGMRSMHNARPATAPVVVSSEVADALKKSGWKNATGPRPYPDKFYPAKEDVADFGKAKRAAGKRSR